jgi:hypothetical protein
MSKNLWIFVIFVLFCAFFAPIGSVADDLAGVMSIETATNSIIELEMPFAPIEKTGPQGYISGVFSGDGGEYSDRLFKYEPISGLLTNAVWGGYSWFDPATGLHSFMSAAPGDILYFFRTDDEPFSFSVFGRLPISPASSSSPHFSSIAVNPTNETVSLAVSPTDHTFDIFSAESTNVATAFTSEWTHLLRAPSAKYPALFSDSAPIPGKTKLFLASDATRDSDGDGLSDAMESYVYGTSPVNPDTDGDGICDLFEIAWGQSPFELNANVFSWKESFEKPVHTIGNIANKNGWKVEGVASASVVEGNSFNGMAHLSVTGEMDVLSEVSHSIDAPFEEIWIDVYLKNNFSYLSNNEECAFKFAVQFNGCLIATDGDSIRTNETFAIDAEKWNRYTMRVNNHAREWDIYVNGVMVFSGLKFHSNAQPVKDLVFSNGDGFVDELSITTTRPTGLSSDGDLMPDEWEISSFGNLLCDGLGDFDGDGLSDAEESAANTNPMLPDSDFDGIADTWEVKNGLDPLCADDAVLDPDSDGLDNLLEFELGSNPLFFEVDPRVKKSGLYTEFYVTTKEIFDIPDFSELDPIGTFVSQSVFWQNGTWPDSIKAKGDYFACRLSGYVCIPRTGDYTFYVTSDDGSRLIVDGKTVTSDSVPHPARESSGTLHLEAGWRPLELTYYENSSVASLSLSWSGPDMPKSLIPSEALCHNSESVVDKRLIGFASGLEAEYYSLSPSVFAMPDFSSASPTASCIANTITFPSSAAAWDGAPIDIVDYFAVRFAGYILIRSSGVYTFYLNSDDGSKLYIGSKLLIDNDGDHSMKKLEASIPLSKGLHPIFVEYYEKEGNAGLELTWCRPDGTVGVIPETSFFHAIAPIDGDMDEIPDWWEREYGLNPSDPADAGLDSDSDGLTNLEEFLAESNPQKIDTDLDGMSDNWEVSYGLCPFINDSIEDPDSDGLVNAEEYLQGSEPVAVDTDGDGLCDHDEKILGTNPREIDSVTIGDELVSANSGSVINISVDAPQAFAVNVNLLQEWHDYSKVKVEPPAINRIIFKIDGHFIGSKDVVFNPSNVVSSLFYTPVLPRGSHNLQIEWTSPDFRVRADIAGISVNRLSGVDFEQIVRRRNEAPGFVSTRISPAFIEGESSFPWLVSSTNAVVSPCGATNWYLYIPFDQRSVDAEIIFEGLVSTNVTVVWEPTDLFANPEDIKLRRMDKLLFSGTPDNYQGGIVEVFTNGAFACSYSPGSSVELLFPYRGEWNVHAVWRDERSGESVTSQTMQVMCVDCSFPSLQPACQVGVPRIWNCPDMTVDLFYDTDMHTSFSINTDGEATILVGDTRGDRWVAARLYEGGPIVDVSRIDPMWAVGSFGNIAYLIESFEDSERCRTYLRQYGASRSVRFRVRSYTSSVVFDDYTTERWITPFDFDRNGIAWFEFLKSKPMASVCHTVEIFQNEVRIGEAVYGNAVLPEELR